MVPYLVPLGKCGRLFPSWMPAGDSRRTVIRDNVAGSNEQRSFPFVRAAANTDGISARPSFLSKRQTKPLRFAMASILLHCAALTATVLSWTHVLEPSVP